MNIEDLKLGLKLLMGGTPLEVDIATKNHTFGHYARILVDIDLSKRIFDEIMV